MTWRDAEWDRTEALSPSFRPVCGVHAPARWYAAYTRARHEKHVRDQWEEKRIDCFLPLYGSARRWKDRHKELQLALFPGYVFVHVRPEDRSRVCRLQAFVSFSGHPAALDESEIESLWNGVANGVCVEPYPYLKV